MIRIKILGLAAAMIAALILAGVGRAEAQTVLCSGVSVDQVASCDKSGYASVMNTSHWGMVKGHNCTNYVAYRLSKNGVQRPTRQLGSANAWAANARNLGYTVNRTAAVGAVATYGSRNHIAFVEEVGPDYLVLSEDHYPGYYPDGRFQKIRVVPGDNWYPEEFIHFGSAPISDGEFVVENGYVYRVVGGAPLYVSSFDVFGGEPPLRRIQRNELLALRATPKDGTVVHGATSGRVFVFAGGAPQYVSSWNRIGGVQSTAAVDDFALDHPAEASHLTAVRPVPADGTMLVGTSGRVFVVAGGAPQYVSSFAAVGGQRPFTRVDDWVFENAGGAAHARFILRFPADGTALRGGRSGRVFIVAGGAPLYVKTFAGIGGERDSTVVDDATIDGAGGSGDQRFLRAIPEQGTFIRGVRSTRVFRIMDGRPLYISSFAPFGGVQPFTNVDDAAIDTCDHLLCDPYGRLDSAELRPGGLRLWGWAHDPNVEGAIAVRVDIDGKRGSTWRADVSRVDVDAYYHRGDRFGYDILVAAARGQRLCVVAENAGMGAERQLGCATA